MFIVQIRKLRLREYKQLVHDHTGCWRRWCDSISSLPNAPIPVLYQYTILAIQYLLFEYYQVFAYYPDMLICLFRCAKEIYVQRSTPVKAFVSNFNKISSDLILRSLGFLSFAGILRVKHNLFACPSCTHSLSIFLGASQGVWGQGGGWPKSWVKHKTI